LKPNPIRSLNQSLKKLNLKLKLSLKPNPIRFLNHSLKKLKLKLSYKRSLKLKMKV